MLDAVRFDSNVSLNVFSVSMNRHEMVPLSCRLFSTSLFEFRAGHPICFCSYLLRFESLNRFTTALSHSICSTPGKTRTMSSQKITLCSSTGSYGIFLIAFAPAKRKCWVLSIAEILRADITRKKESGGEGERSVWLRRRVLGISQVELCECASGRWQGKKDEKKSGNAIHKVFLYHHP